MQYEEENKVCMLCLKSSKCALEDVKVVTTQMLKVLRLDLELDVKELAVICRTCSVGLEKFYDFKTMCLHTEDYVNSFRNDRGNLKLDLEEIYLRKNEKENIAVPKYICNPICRLCMQIVEADCYMSLSAETKDVALTKIILRRCFSELDLDITKNPVICTSCNESLHMHFSFIKKRLVEDEIKQYCEIEEGNNKPQMESNSGLQFGTGNTSNCTNGCPTLDARRSCSENELHDETKSKLGNLMQKELHIKCEINDYAKPVDNEISNLLKICHEDEQNDVADLKHENLDVKRHKSNTKHEKIDIKSDQGDVTFGYLIQDTTPTIPAYTCAICSYKTNQKAHFKQHELIHKNASEVQMYQCDVCKFKTRHKRNLIRHTVIHKTASEATTHQCDVCAYKTRHKGVLKQHMLVHKTASEVPTYQCDVCSFKTRHKRAVQGHMFIHKIASDTMTFSCGICTYKAKRKAYLRKHLLTHKVVSEVTNYQCDVCTFKTRHKGVLKRHLLIHKTASEVITY